MAFSREQIWLLKAAQRQARIGDEEYRVALGGVTKLPGCRSSKDPRLTDEHLDTLMSYFEAIYWRGVDGGALEDFRLPSQPFRTRCFWANKNRKDQSSRDRYVEEQLVGTVAALEASLGALGCGAAYCAAIKRRTGPGWKYKAALERTLHFKQLGNSANAAPLAAVEDRDPF